jgi:adenine-specific DNA methylase
MNKLHTYIYNVEVDVNTQEVLNEVDNDDLIKEVQLRNLDIGNSIEVEKYELRKIICNTLDINEMYDDEEIFDMLRDIWRYRR